MVYKPSSKFLNSLNTNDSSGYRPSEKLLSSLSSNDEESSNGMRMPFGVNFATGLMSLAFPHDQRELIKNIPQAMAGRQPGIPEKVAQGFGEYAPFALGGGSTLLGSTLGAGAFGAMEHEPGQEGLIDRTLGLPPGGRVRNSIEDMLINALTHGIGRGASKVFGKNKEAPQINFKNPAEFQPGESEFTNVPFKPPAFLNKTHAEPLSAKISEELHSNITGNKTPEESGKLLADETRATYSNLLNKHTERYNKIFDHPTNQESVFTGEPFKVKEIRMDKSDYVKKFHDYDFNDENLKQFNEKLLDNPTTENAHSMQSELGSEIGYLKKQREKGLLDDTGKNKLSSYVTARDTLKNDLRNTLENIDPKLRNEYDAVTESWKNNVLPFHSDKELKQIAEGKIKNPTSKQIVSIFKNPEEDMQTVIGHLPEASKTRIVHLGSGNVGKAAEPKDLLTGMKAIERKGLTSYVNPHIDQAFKNLKNNVKMEEEAGKLAEKNAKIVESLRMEHQRAESARIAAAKTREKIRQLAGKEANKVNNAKQKELQSQYEQKIKEEEESRKRRSDLIRTIVGGFGGATLVHGFGIDPKDLLGSYLGKLIAGKR